MGGGGGRSLQRMNTKLWRYLLWQSHSVVHSVPLYHSSPPGRRGEGGGRREEGKGEGREERGGRRGRGRGGRRGRGRGGRDGEGREGVRAHRFFLGQMVILPVAALQFSW